MHIKTTFVAIGSLCALSITSCQKAETPNAENSSAEPAEQQEVIEEPAPAPAPKVAAATPPPATPAPAATPAPSNLAPEGVFYLVQKVSVETDAGIVGLNPGTKAVKQPDGKFLADGHTVTLQPGQITNDLTLARQAIGADQAAQQRIRQVMAAQAAATQVQAPAPTETQEIAASPQPAPAMVQENGAYTREYVDPTGGKEGGLQSSNNLNAKHTRTGEGILWQKSPDGKWWVPVKRLSVRDTRPLPPNKPAR